MDLELFDTTWQAEELEPSVCLSHDRKAANRNRIARPRKTVYRKCSLQSPGLFTQQLFRRDESSTEVSLTSDSVWRVANRTVAI